MRLTLAVFSVIGLSQFAHAFYSTPTQRRVLTAPPVIAVAGVFLPCDQTGSTGSASCIDFDEPSGASVYDRIASTNTGTILTTDSLTSVRVTTGTISSRSWQNTPTTGSVVIDNAADGRYTSHAGASGVFFFCGVINPTTLTPAQNYTFFEKADVTTPVYEWSITWDNGCGQGADRLVTAVVSANHSTRGCLRSTGTALNVGKQNTVCFDWDATRTPRIKQWVNGNKNPNGSLDSAGTSTAGNGPLSIGIQSGQSQTTMASSNFDSIRMGARTLGDDEPALYHAEFVPPGQ